MAAKKDEKILADAKEQNIPVFIFTAKDKLAFEILCYYYDTCIDALCVQSHNEAVLERVKEFKEWQSNNPDKVKLPD